MKENKAQKFTEERRSDDVPINLMENMFNQQSKMDEQTQEEIPPFPGTPFSIKLSDRKLLSQAFRVSFFVHDLLLWDKGEEDWEILVKENLKKPPEFNHKNMSIFEDEIKEEQYSQSNLLITYKDIFPIANSKEELPESDKIVMERPSEEWEIDSDLEEDYRRIWKQREEIKKANLEEKWLDKSMDL